MAQRLKKIIVVCVLLVFIRQSNAQEERISQNFRISSCGTLHLENAALFYRGNSFSGINLRPGLQAANKKPFVLSNAWYAEHTGFFCRQELRLAQAISLPLHIRLGTLEYVNRLEGK